MTKLLPQCPSFRASGCYIYVMAQKRITPETVLSVAIIVIALGLLAADITNVGGIRDDVFAPIVNFLAGAFVTLWNGTFGLFL